MKVLMFGWEFPPYISGGLGTACFGLTKGLTEQGVQVTLVLPTLAGRASGGAVDLIGADNIMITESDLRTEHRLLERIHIQSPLTPYLTGREYADRAVHTEHGHTHRTLNLTAHLTGTYGADLMSEIARYRSIAGLIGREKPCDVIHAHDWMTFPAGIAARQASGRPLISHVHATEFDRNGDHVNRQVYAIERKGLHASDRIIAVSDFTRRKLIEQYGITRAKIDVVHNGILDPRPCSKGRWVKNVREKIVLFLGRITLQKGPEYFIDAARQVIDRVPNVRFVMAGSGDMYSRMVVKMAAMRLGRYFHFTGFLRGEDVERMYAMSDLYVMPSVSEPFGIAPLEAMRHGIPVIISRQSGVAEVVDAIQVDFWDVDQLARSIISVLTDAPGTRRMVAANHVRLRSLTWAAAARKTIAAYHTVMPGMS